ncbi:MAG: Aldehyde ferredoxin oxidoreductase, partial [Deltaproteobacteria bacterium]|nr:Aldehyde ferredoxin oxidoreductase [Deltaproteobacteria bacterium]
MAKAYSGRVLRVDLTTGDIKIEEPGEVIYRTYFGGGGLSSYYLLKELKPGIDPLGPENILVFASTVCTGIPISG